MNRVLICVIAASFLVLAQPYMYSFGGKEKKEAEPAPQTGASSGHGETVGRESARLLYESALTGQIVEITGLIRLVGNAPFPQLVLTDVDSNDWHISDENRKLLEGYEQQTLSIRGQVELLEMKLANGNVVGTRRILSGITILP